MDGNWRETLVPGGVFGNLRIVKRLGSGGMGVVFLAENPKGARCALKVLAPSDASDESRFEERFKNEAAFALTARHPNLVEVWDAGRDSATGFTTMSWSTFPVVRLGNLSPPPRTAYRSSVQFR